ncbi:MAG: hypothetical protein IPN99_05635 [Bacteroidetes bacterium]|nr:hypothetical protein [Bacteroidota bacterium]
MILQLLRWCGTGCISISQYPANTITGPTSNGQTVVITLQQELLVITQAKRVFFL